MVEFDVDTDPTNTFTVLALYSVVLCSLNSSRYMYLTTVFYFTLLALRELMRFYILSLSALSLYYYILSEYYINIYCISR